MYTPVNEVKFSKDTFTVFNGLDTKERYFVPWKVKEVGIRNSFCIVTACLVDNYISLN